MKSAFKNPVVFAALALTAFIVAGCGGSSSKGSAGDTGASTPEAPAVEQEATYATYRHDEPGDVE